MEKEDKIKLKREAWLEAKGLKKKSKSKTSKKKKANKIHKEVK